MKKQLLKSMLVGVMTLAASSAWAETFYSQDYEGGASADWSSSVSGRFTPTILEDGSNHYLSVDQSTRNNNGCILTSTSLQGKVAEEKDFTMLFDVKIGSSTNQTPVEFNIYDAANSAKILALVATGTYATTYTVNGNSEQKPAISAGGGKGLDDLAWMSFKLSRSGSLTYLTIINKATEEVVFERAIISTLSEKGGLGKMEFITKRYNANFAIDNIVVRDIEDGDVPVATPTTYTVKFQDEGGNVIKDDLVVNTVVGTEVTASASMVASFYANDKKYIYVSGNGAITTVEEESANVITLVFREAAIWNYTVNATGEESTVIKVLASGSAFEGDAVTVSYPLYINVDGVLWTKTATNKEFRTSITLDSENMEANLAYNATEISNVIYLSEGEDIAGTTAFTGSNADIRSSNAAAGWTSENIDFVTLPVGKYKVYGVIIANSGTPVISFALGAREVLSISANNSNWTTGEAEFVVAKESALSFVGGNAKSGLDFVYIQSLGTPTPEELAAAAQADLAAAAKAQLQEAITQATALNTYANDETLAGAITAAQATAENPSATLEDIAGVLTALQLSATKVAKTTLTDAVAMAKTFGMDTTAAQAVLDKKDATVQELATALKALYDAAVPAANKILSEAKSFFNTFDKTTAEALAEDFAAVETALAGTDINAIKTAAEALIAKAIPAAKTALGKVVGYLEVMDNEAINADMAALKAAMEANDLNGMLAAAKQTKTDLTTAVPAFLNQVKATIDAGKADGKNVDALEAAYNAATAAIGQYVAAVAAGDNGNVIAVGESIYNVIKAAQAYEEANRPDPAGYIVNAEFNPEADPIGWTGIHSDQFYDLGMGLIGTYQVRGEHPASTVDETHLATEFAAALECRWATNYAAYTQTTVEIPAGAYKLTFDVENTNASTTKANYENRFNVTVGETVYTDESTEWMQGKSAWTTHTIPFALTEASPITISLGFGTGSNNYGVGNTPALFVSHLKLEAISALDLALAELEKAIEAAEAQAVTYTIGDGLFLYPESEIAPLNEAIAAAKAAFDAKESEKAVKAATEALSNFLAGFAPAINAPKDGQGYYIANKTAEGNLSINETNVTVAKDAVVYITAVEGGYVLSNDDALYIFKTTGNTWTFSTTANKDEAYIVNFNYQPDGTYTISGANGLFGTDNTTEGSTVWANKTVDKNGYWTITEVDIDEAEALQAAKEKLEAEIAAAEAMKTTGRTQGLDDFNAAIATAESAKTATTVEELTAALQALKTAEQTFKKANWYINFAAGEYYVIDAETDLKMAAGHDWGTRGIVNELGLDLTLTPNEETHTVTFDSKVSNGGDNHFLGSNLYMDAPAYGWALEYQGFGFYIVDPASDQYINFDADNNLVLSTTPREFIIVTKLGVIEERMGELADAKVDAPVDATFLLQNPNFNRNDQRVAAWEWIPTETAEENAENWNNHNFNGGNNVNNCAESFHAAFTVKQTVEGAPKGMYALTVQGFYRQDAYEGDAPEAPTFFANGVIADVPVKTGEEGNMAAASESFTNGLYTIEPIMFDVTGEGDDAGKINVGVTATVHNQWVIFDNFKLMYYGPNVTTAISEVQANGQQNVEGAYTISGQKVQSLKKGLYIINGKKVVKK